MSSWDDFKKAAQETVGKAPGAGQYVHVHRDSAFELIADYEALLAERDALRNDHGSMRNALKNARYRIEQGRVWNGMGWTLTGLHAYQQQVALDEIDAALQGAQP